MPSTLASTTITVNASSPPIVIDLNGDGISYISQEGGVVFKDKISGESYQLPWINPDDGLLVIDANNSGNVDELKEFVFTDWATFAKTDAEAVAEVFDSNNNLILDIKQRFEQFRI